MFLPGFLRTICHRPAHDVADLRDLVNAHERVHFRHQLRQFVAEALRQAAGNNDGLAAPVRIAQFDGLKNRVRAFFLRGINERTGVDDDGVGLRGVIRDLDTALEQRAEHDFGVHEIFGAAKGNKADAQRLGTGIFLRHRRQSLTRFLRVAISEAPNSKLQHPEKLQCPNFKNTRCLMLGAWNFSGCWSLEFGAFYGTAGALVETFSTALVTVFAGAAVSAGRPSWVRSTARAT